VNGIEAEIDERYGRKVHEGLERSYNLAKAGMHELRVTIEQARFVIFSDLHRGVRDGADDFLRCEKAYSAALGYYLESGYTLIVLGDAEELWECRPAPVVDSYRATLLLEAEFLKQDRYYKMYGNHDDYWEKESGIRTLLMPIFGPSLQIKENLRLLFEQGQAVTNEIFLVHGHQGDYLSDQSRKISKWFVRYVWRPFQRLTKLKLTTPAKDYKLRDEHSIAMYRWAVKKSGLALIAGHTHLPVFEIRAQLRTIEKELEAARLAGETTRVAELRARLELARARARERDGRGFSMAKPCYFNTGCCSFSDGDVTGIEIADGQIKLVRWPDDAGNPKPKILASTVLHDVFESLRS
jgi:UDP-2,3-diacylglucosamine pyrophosphatase LpxH